MNTLFQHKKMYAIAATAILLMTGNLSNAQEPGKKEDGQKDKKKKQVTRIIIYKDEDGKTTKVDTTIMGDSDFKMEAFAKNFNFKMPELPDLSDLPEPPEPPMPPMPPDDNFFYYHFNDRGMADEERAEFKKEMEHLKKSKEQWKRGEKEEFKEQMDDLKNQLQDLKRELDKMKKDSK